MKKIAVIESKNELHALPTTNGLELFCLNPDMWPILDREGIPYQKIQDEYIQEYWKRILIWTRETALTWFDQPELKEILSVNGVNLGNVILSDFRHALLQIATNVCVANKIIDQSGPNIELLVFKESSHSKRSFFGKPELQDTINYILEDMGKKRGIRVTIINYTNHLLGGVNWKQLTREFLANCFSFFNFFTKIPQGSIVSFGGANHLEPFWDEFKSRNIPFVIFDDTFRPSYYRKAKQLQVPYLVQGKWSRLFFLSEFSKVWTDLRKKLKEIPVEILKSKIFVFDGEDLSRLINLHFEGSENDMKSRIDSILYARNLIQKRKASAIVLDEDTSSKRVYAATFVAMLAPVFVTSHGVTGADYRISSEIKSATYGDYFSNSEFEKEKYCTMGWNPEKIIVLGVPRYDAIFRLKQKAKPNLGKKIILYCPHRLSEKKTRAFGISTPGYVTKQNTLYLIEATENLNCELWIKPHADAGDIPAWKSFEKQALHVRVFSPNVSVFELLQQSDILVTTFSSVIIEGLLFDMPVITLNFTGRPDFHPYANFGVTKGVYEPEHLRSTILAALEDQNFIKSLKDARDKHFDYFCGFCDGKNTRRSVDFILSKGTKHGSQKQINVFQGI